MVAPALLYEGAKIVTGLAAGRSQRRAEKEQLKLNRERLQSAKGRDSAARLSQFLNVRGTQRAAFAAGGLAGGMTRRLFEADSRLKYLQGQQAAAAGFSQFGQAARAAYSQRAAASRFGGLQSALSGGADILSIEDANGTTYGEKLYEQALKAGRSILSL